MGCGIRSYKIEVRFIPPVALRQSYCSDPLDEFFPLPSFLAFATVPRRQ